MSIASFMERYFSFSGIIFFLANSRALKRLIYSYFGLKLILEAHNKQLGKEEKMMLSIYSSFF